MRVRSGLRAKDSEASPRPAAAAASMGKNRQRAARIAKKFSGPGLASRRLPR